MVIKLCHIHIDTEILYQILDVLKLVNEKKGETALSDICELEKRWESEFRDKLEKNLEKHASLSTSISQKTNNMFNNI